MDAGERALPDDTVFSGAMESIKPGRLSDCGEDVSAASGNGALHSGAGREGGCFRGADNAADGI